MLKGILAVLFAFVALQCALSTPAEAQVDTCLVPVICGYSTVYTLLGQSGCFPPIPLGATDCSGLDFTMYCWAPSYRCPPAAAAREDAPGNCSSGCVAGSPINLATGNVYIEEVDVKIPGVGGGLTLERTWNSMWPSTQSASQVGLFGPNWRSNFEERVFLGSDNYMKYARGDGSFWSLAYSGAGYSVAAPANATATLTPGSSYWTITFKNGEQRLFDNTSGNLIAIIDRNGNSTQLTYDSVGRLTTVTDPASRHLYFSYASQTSFLVTGVTSDFGVSVSYSYDSQSRLSQVTEPDLSTLNFDYNGQSLIADVKDANGKILESHTYDTSGRGLTSSRANGVDAVTVSYINQ